jgi:hypothetical protein
MLMRYLIGVAVSRHITVFWALHFMAKLDTIHDLFHCSQGKDALGRRARQ